MAQISILGCGWLGLPLARHLISEGFSVSGSTTATEKLVVLEQSGIKAFQIAVSENGIFGDFERFLKGSETLIIDIPPKLRGPEKENFVGKIDHLIPAIEQSLVQNVLFVSSTSVFSEQENIPIITEKTKPNGTSESAKQLMQAENSLQQNPHFKTTILRFAGLIGEDRHPVRFLAGRENIENPDGPINLIHQEDCIGIISKILALSQWNETFNAAAPLYPSRKQYYTEKALEQNLIPPGFSHGKSLGKIISAEKVQTLLNYKFKQLDF